MSKVISVKNILLVLLGAALAAIVLSEKKRPVLEDKQDGNVIKFPSAGK